MLEREIITLNRIKVMGVATRTSNTLELTSEAKIVRLHEEFIKQEISSKINPKVDDRMIALYTDYEDQERGEYTYAIGHSVEDVTSPPESLAIYEIPPGQYLKVTTERGFLNEVLPEAWKGIWKMSDEQLGGTRAYTVDFEFHNYDDNLSSDLQVDIYLSILPK